ncbi:MAG: hypothetical protein EXS14_01485 [Planctomycetes bacterium]|nr:hypothetical protein [Planctomycetota bacterium]
MKDNRIPPRGFNNATFAAGGAPAVDTDFADGQYWHDTLYVISAGTVTAEVTLNYQQMTKHYVEALKNGNITNGWSETLYTLWLATNKAVPVQMVQSTLTISK